MGRQEHEVTVCLVPTQVAVRAGEPLALRLAVRNGTDRSLSGAAAEVTAEVERGVLITWAVTVRSVPAGSECGNALLSVTPPWSLPLNVPAGPGRWHVGLRTAAGELLAEHELELAVEGPQTQAR